MSILQFAPSQATDMDFLWTPTLGFKQLNCQLPTGRVRPKRSRKEDPMLITDSTMVRAKGAVRTQIQRLNLSIGLVSLSKGCASPSIPSLGPQGTASKQCPPRRFWHFLNGRSILLTRKTRRPCPNQLIKEKSTFNMFQVYSSVKFTGIYIEN